MSSAIEELLRDARLILEYSFRAGKLQDSALAQAINDCEGNLKNPAHVLALQHAVSNMTSRIAPMTLVDLRAGRNPFDRRNMRWRGRWQVALSIATLVLIAVIAFYQYVVQAQESALRAYKEVVEARGSERITDARAMAQDGRALDKDSCRREAYHKARHELRQLAIRSAKVSNDLKQLADASPWPLVDVLRRISTPAQNAVSTSQTHAGTPGISIAYAEAQSTSNPGLTARSDSVGTSTGNGPSPRNRMSTGLALDSAQEAPDGIKFASNNNLCDVAQSPLAARKEYPGWLRNVVLDAIDDFCFAKQLDIDLLYNGDPFKVRVADAYYGGAQSSDPVAKVERRMRIETGWLLPFLYGLLGGCVYVMRRLLFDTKAAVVENVVILLRLALGALAGVAVGWFATPSTAVVEAVAAGSLPYAMAFLAGFSIDIMFSLLDRLNRALLDKGDRPESPEKGEKNNPVGV